MEHPQDILRTPNEREQMRDLLNAKREKLDNDYKKSRQNEAFTQVYEQGWQKLAFLIEEHRSAAQLYIFLARNIDKSNGAVIASQSYLCEAIDVSRTTLWRASKKLEEIGSLRRWQVEGGIYAYSLNDGEIWKSWDSAKESSAFRTKSLSKKSGTRGYIERKISVLLKEGKKQ
ncbi:MAG: hypothetical protein ACRBBO_14390 [Cognatishimia sp.]